MELSKLKTCYKFDIYILMVFILETLHNFIEYQKKKDSETIQLINQINQNTQIKLKELEKKYSLSLTIKKPLTYIVIIVLSLMWSCVILLDSLRLKRFIMHLVKNWKYNRQRSGKTVQLKSFSKKDQRKKIEKIFNHEYQIYLNHFLNKKKSPNLTKDSLINNKSNDLKSNILVDLNCDDTCSINV